MMHTNDLFLILLICCWVVPASLMAEKGNMGMAIFIADMTVMIFGGINLFLLI